MPFPSNYPKEKPVWLKQWFRFYQTVRTQFAQHIGRLALQAISRSSGICLSWSERQFRMNLGAHTVTWTLQENGDWRIACNCGFTNPYCLHAYASAWLLQQICQRENWQIGGETSRMPEFEAQNRQRTGQTPGTSSRLPGGNPQGHGMVNRPVTSGGVNRLSSEPYELQAEPRRTFVFSNPSTARPMSSQQMRPPLPSQPQYRPKADDLFSFSNAPAAEFRQIACRLIVEADFHHERGKVGIRFNVEENGGLRSLLSLASLNNIIMEILSPGVKKRIWSPEDTEFLKWMRQHLRKIPYTMYNLTMLKLTESEFGDWRVRWQSQPRRFIDQSNQSIIAPPGHDNPCRQVVDLVADGDMIIISLQIEFADGTRRKPHEIMRNMGGTTESTLFVKQLVEWKPPVSWAQMNRYFARKSPGLPRNQAAAYLSEVLEGHLELIQPGPLVEIHNQREINASFVAGVSSIGLTLGCRVDGTPCPMNAPQVNQCTVAYRQGKFHINAVTESTESVARRMELRRFAAPHAEFIQGEAIFRNSFMGARQLQEAWAKIPADVEKKAAPKIAALLCDAPSLAPELKIAERDGFVFSDIVWTNDTGVKVSNDQVLQAVAHDSNLIQLDDGGWLALNTDGAREALERLARHGICDKEIMTRRDATASLSTYLKTGLVNVADDCRKQFSSLMNRPMEPLPSLSDSMKSILRPYQMTGYEFLADRMLCQMGCILADDMGLGKTLQILALLQAWKLRPAENDAGRLSVLIICPATLVGHWISQMNQFAPELKPLAAVGTAATRQAILKDDAPRILVTHYGLLRYDQEFLEKKEFDFVILDEAQTIKNPVAQVTLAAKSIPASHRIAITGTPLENRLNDLWSIMDFLNKGWFGSLETFEKRYAGEALSQLARQLRPFMLRRTKEQVALELPPKNVEVLSVEMTESQRGFYDETLAEAKLEASQGGSNFEILASLTRLRQVCCDPDLLLKKESGIGSGKLDVLLEKLEELLQSGHSALVFSQFTSMLDIIGRKLSERLLPFKIITGNTSLEKRNQLVADFERSPNPEIFLLSLKAAGTGLTLTKADYVFLFDPWWNPAAERQAIDRTHRIGQTKPVFAYRMIAAGTIEERVMKLLEAKQQLFDAVIEESDGEASARLDRKELLDLLNG